MSKPINVRITDELEAKINKAVEEEKTTVTDSRVCRTKKYANYIFSNRWFKCKGFRYDIWFINWNTPNITK